MQDLVDEGLLASDEASRGYKLGSAILALGGNYVTVSELHQEVAPVLNQVVLDTGESAHIVIRNNLQVLYLNKHFGPYFSNIQTQTGKLNPVHATSSGKVLLAYSSEDKIDIILNQPLITYTEYTLTNPLQIRKLLPKVKKQGYAFSNEELTIGNYSLSVPVFNMEGENVCALTLVGPTSRLTPAKKEQYIRTLIKAGKTASERLGYDS